MSLPFLTRSRTWPTEASTAYPRPRNFLRVRVLAGLSTMSRFLAIGVSETSGTAAIFRQGLCATRGQAGDTSTGPPSAARLGRGTGRAGRPALAIYKEGEFPVGGEKRGANPIAGPGWTPPYTLSW